MMNLFNLLFPRPQEVEPREGSFRLTPQHHILIHPSPEDLVRTAAMMLCEAMGKRADCSLHIQETPEVAPHSLCLAQNQHTPHIPSPEGKSDQAYTLCIDKDSVCIAGASAAGLFYGAQTLARLLTCAPAERWPCCLIKDWPDMKYRGLFFENKWGPDLMTLDDYRTVIDFMASLKMNFLGIGLYGCWCVQYLNQITEFLLVHFPDYPQLKTPKKMRYYSPTRQEHVEFEYLPRMAEDNFFGDLVAYGKTRNVIVRPHFNSLGHNTLIPRLIPEIAAKDANGKPKGYGFCTSNPKTYEVLFSLYDYIIENFLLPHGVDYFHVGLDEIYDVAGVDPHNWHRKVNPWCECERCRMASPENKFLDFLFKVLKHVANAGINHISMWNDQLARHMNLLNEDFAKRLETEGLKDKLILNWWHYGLQFPESLRPELGIRRFVTPMSGYFFWRAYQPHVPNIEGMLALGHRDGAEGVETYGVFDWAYHRFHCCTADASWNASQAGDVEAFEERYATAIAKEHSEEARRGLKALDRAASCPLIGGLCHYTYTYVAQDEPYPRAYPAEALRRLLATDNYEKTLSAAIADATEARDALSRIVPPCAEADRAVKELVAEAERFLLIYGAFEQICRLRKTLFTVGKADNVAELLTDAAGAIDEYLSGDDGYDKKLAVIEQTKMDALVPQTVRELTYMRDFFVNFARLLRDRAEAARRGEPVRIDTDELIAEASVTS